jgi:hypothetical protein
MEKGDLAKNKAMGDICAARAAAKATGGPLDLVFCGFGGCLFLGSVAAVAAHERGKHNDELGVAAARRLKLAGVPNFDGKGCGLSAAAGLVDAMAAALDSALPPGHVVTTALTQPCTATARALRSAFPAERSWPAAPAAVLEDLICLLPAPVLRLRLIPRPRRACAACGTNVDIPPSDLERLPLLYVRPPGPERPASARELADCWAPPLAQQCCCGAAATVSEMPNDGVLFETPFGAASPPLLVVGGVALELAAIIAEAPAAHAVLFVRSAGAWGMLDDGAFIANPPPPKPDAARIVFYRRSAAQPPMAQAGPATPATAKVRRPLGGPKPVLGARPPHRATDSDDDEMRILFGPVAADPRPPSSWLLVPLLAAAARAPPAAEYPALALEALGARVFAAAVSLVRRCGATPGASEFNAATGYTGAAVQERAWSIVQRTLATARGAAAETDRLTQNAVEEACRAGPPALAWSPAPPRELAFGAIVTVRGEPHTVTETAGLYARLRAPNGDEFDDVPANAGRPRTVPSNYAPRAPPLIENSAFQPPVPHRLVLAAVLATAVGITPPAVAAASAVAALSPAGFSATVAAIRAVTRGAPLVPASAFERGALRPERRAEAWQTLLDIAASNPEAAVAARALSDAAPPADVDESGSLAPLRPPIAGNVVMCRFLLGARFVLIAARAGFAIIAPVSDTSAHIADIPFSVLSFAAPGISASQAPPARSQQNAASDYVAVPAARLPNRPVLRAFIPRLLPRGVLGLSSGARRSTSAPVRPGCICGPTRRQGQRHGPDCPLSTVRARAEAARTNEPIPPEPARPEPQPREPLAPRRPMPSLNEIASAHWQLFDSIPQRARAAVASAFGRTVAELNMPDGWAGLLAFARVIFARPRVRKCTSADVIISRARRWPAEAAEMWHAIAEDFAEAAPPLPSATRFEVDDSDLPRGLAARMLDTAVDIDSLPDDVAKKSLGLARRGYFSRAVTALSAARVISAPTAEQTEAMRGLHPPPSSATLVPVPPLSPFGGAPTFSRKQVRKALHGFVLGSAAGMSGLSPKHLLDMAAFSGSTAMDSIALVVARLAEGRVDEQARKFIYGARHGPNGPCRVQMDRVGSTWTV